MPLNRDGSHIVKAVVTSFVDAEPANFDGFPDSLAVVVTVEQGDERPMQDLALSLDSARQMILRLLQCLAHHGDEKAQVVLDKHFTP